MEPQHCMQRICVNVHVRMLAAVYNRFEKKSFFYREWDQIHQSATQKSRARICKRLRSPGIDSKETISPAHVAWRAGTSNRVIVPARQAGNRFLTP
jgi:hypothetical protein